MNKEVDTASHFVRMSWRNTRLGWKVFSESFAAVHVFAFVGQQAWASRLLWWLHVPAGAQVVVAIAVACAFAAGLGLGAFRHLEELLRVEDTSGTWLEELGLRPKREERG